MLELSKDTFEKEVNSGLVLVNFGVEHCRACIRLLPEIEELATFYKEIKFAKLNVDEELAEKYNILGLPCLILFNKGREIARVIGAYPREKLKEKLDSMLKSQTLS